MTFDGIDGIDVSPLQSLNEYERPVRLDVSDVPQSNDVIAVFPLHIFVALMIGFG